MIIKYQSNCCHLLTRCPALLSNKADPVVNAVCLMKSLLAPQFLRSVSQMKCVTCTGLSRDGRGSRGCIPQAVAISWTSSLLTCSPYLTWEFPRYLCGRFLPLKSHATFPGKPCYPSEDGTCAQRALWSAPSLSGTSYLTYHLLCWSLFPPLGCNQHEGRCLLFLVHHKREQWYLRCNRRLVRK